MRRTAPVMLIGGTLGALVAGGFVALHLRGDDLQGSVPAGEGRSQGESTQRLAERLLGPLLAMSDQAKVELRLDDVPRSETQLDSILAIIDRGAGELAGLPGDSVADAISNYLFDDLGFVCEAEEADLKLSLLPYAVKNRRGSELALSALYLLVAERMGVVARGALLPGHFFVRVQRGELVRNVELSRRGEAMPDEWYRGKYGPPRQRGDYWRDLGAREIEAVFRWRMADAYRDAGLKLPAMDLYRQATEVLPGLAEAHAGLGALHFEGKDYERAALDFARAEAANPSLPGLAASKQALASALARD